MDADWITSPTARRILSHYADPRPSWLWSQDGESLLWRNEAARYFNVRQKRSGLRLSPDAVPIRGQVARLIRLGSTGRTSLARVQFLAGDKPVAATCSCTPLMLSDGSIALLLTTVDPVDDAVREALGELGPDALSTSLFPADATFRLSPPGEPAPESEGSIAIVASPAGHVLIIGRGEAAPTIAKIRAEEGAAPDLGDAQDLADMAEPLLPMGLTPTTQVEHEAPTVTGNDGWDVSLPEASEGDTGLASLFDRLASDADLYSPLTAADENFVPPDAVAEEPGPADIAEDAAQTGDDLIGAVIEYADDPETPEVTPTVTDETPRSHWLITGRGFRALGPRRDEDAPLPLAELPDVEGDATTPAADIEPVAAAPERIEGASEAEVAERVSRYNFEELGRILTDRVSNDAGAPADVPSAVLAAPTGIVSLNAETLVLNRLPLALLVFRDQQVLFANRAMTDLLGYSSIEGLRLAGIASIFPEQNDGPAGPVSRLTRRDGTLLSVGARLQSVSWQGRAALMLSVNPVEPQRAGHEAAVRSFAEIAAEALGVGFVAADPSGTLTFVSARGRDLLGLAQGETNKPLATIAAPAELDALRTFLDKPARFAETARPHVSVASADGAAELVLFAHGQAGVVEGYFGLVRPRVTARTAPDDDRIEAELLGRLSRGIRRPLNTIVGFADLLREAALAGTTERAGEYARDISTAGHEISVLADELDDFTRLRDGRYATRPSEIDLGSLLESCILRVRQQAGAARVLVRSAISQKLPKVRADRSSLAQALLNLLASAIDHTPIGGSVILSAQRDDDGGVAIHVRDGATAPVDLGERFVVFRDGLDKDGTQLTPVRSGVGLALTRSLLAVNSCSLSVDPTMSAGTLFSLLIPADAIVAE